jgi:hypothetical protein
METAEAGVTLVPLPVDGPVASPVSGPVSSSVRVTLPPQVGGCIGSPANPACRYAVGLDRVPARVSAPVSPPVTGRAISPASAAPTLGRRSIRSPVGYPQTANGPLPVVHRPSTLRWLSIRPKPSPGGQTKRLVKSALMRSRRFWAPSCPARTPSQRVDHDLRLPAANERPERDTDRTPMWDPLRRFTRRPGSRRVRTTSCN